MVRMPVRTLAVAQVLLLTLGLILLANAGASAPGVPWHPLETPDELLAAQRTVPAGETRADMWRQARQQALAIAAESGNTELASINWEEMGPSNMGGRVVDLAFDPTRGDNGTLIAASSGGGVWAADAETLVFKSIWPGNLPQGIGALARASDGTLFVGTGEANPGGGSIVFSGNGVYRSRDGGTTWEHVGLSDSGAIGRMVVDPKNPKRIFVAATGDLFVPGGQRGVYRSTDGGDTWNLVLAGANDTTGAVDLAIDPQNPDNVYTTMWDHRREPDLRRYGGPGSGLYRSTNGGTTWTRAGTGFPTGDLGRMGVAVSATAPNIVYAIVNTTAGPFQGFYKSVDSGATWVNTAPAGDPSGLVFSQSTFGWWFGRLWVDPINPNHVFVAGVSLLSSLDGGVVFAPHTGPHADQHAMIWDPTDPTRVYLGNDGGVYRSDNRGLVNSQWTAAKNQPWMQAYTVDVSQQNPDRFVAGFQDNGCGRSWDAAGTASSSGWTSYCGGDGEATIINPYDQNNIFGCSQYGNCSRSTNAGNNSAGIGTTTSNRRNWTTPILFDPNSTNVMYYAGNRVNRSTTNGNGGWQAISPDLSRTAGRDTAYPFGTAFTVAVSSSDPNTLWVGMDDGGVWRTRNLGGAWEKVVVEPSLSETWVSEIVIDPADVNHVLVTYTGFRSGSDSAHVFETRDGGATWANISGNLPNAPVNDLLLLGDRMVVGTDIGVYASTDGGQNWVRAGEGLPMVVVMDLAYQKATNTVVAGTFGRGLWRLPLP
jgi:hypothetical protein